MAIKGAYDFIVIGGGSAGFAAARTAAALGLDVAVVEGGPEVGGLCILRGCMPSKTMIESGNRANTIRRAGEFGLHVGDWSVNAAEILDRKRRLVAEFAEYRRSQLSSGAFEFIRGMASFSGSHSLEIKPLDGGDAFPVEAKSFLIATGSTSKVLDIAGLCETGFLDSDAVLESATKPASVIILGGGATGIEFAHYFTSVGTKTTVIQRGGQVLKELDSDAAAVLTSSLRDQGTSLFVGTNIVRAENVGGMKRVIFQHEGEEMWVEAEEIIYALGRLPQLGHLHLDKANVHLEHSKLTINSRQQTNQGHIFAAGDAAGPYEVVHIGIQQGELAARNAHKIVHKSQVPLEEMDYRLKLFAIFSSPEAAGVGMTERDLAKSEIPYLVSAYHFRDHGKSIVMGETHGFVKLIVERDSREILGAAAVGPHASELIHEIAVAMYFHATASDLSKVPHYHPTLSEIWTYPAEELASHR